jgi:hypothetical protein
MTHAPMPRSRRCSPPPVVQRSSPVPLSISLGSLPAGVKTVTLTGLVCIDTDETDNLEHDVLSLDLLQGTHVIARLGTLSNQDGTHGCNFKPLPANTAQLTSAPAMATLRLRATQNSATMRTTFYFDDLKLTVGCTP